jgi:CRP-like cAMP-binding protein
MMFPFLWGLLAAKLDLSDIVRRNLFHFRASANILSLLARLSSLKLFANVSDPRAATMLERLQSRRGQLVPAALASDPELARGNRLLAALPADDFALLAPLLDIVHISNGTILCEPSLPLAHVVFPHDCLISLLGVADGRMTLEVGLVGGEGVLGATVALDRTSTQVRAVVQRGGQASCIDSARFRLACAHSPALYKLMTEYAGDMLAQAIQIAVCSRFHVLEARLARSLLVRRDRLQSDKFHLTHEFLAHALGVRRVGVTKAASALQQQGLIIYSRGNIEILDGAGLAASACTCYAFGRDPHPSGAA